MITSWPTPYESWLARFRHRHLGPYPGGVTAAHDYSDLHELIDRLQPDQAEQLRAFVLGLVTPGSHRFRVLQTFEGPRTDLGARARDVMRAEFGQGDADR